MYGGQVVTIFCDAVSTSLIAETLCLKVHALREAAEISREASHNEPIVLVCDASSSCPAGFEEAISRARHVWPYTPIVAIVDSHDAQAMEFAFKHRVHDVLRKPINQAELLLRVQARVYELELLRKVREIRVGDTHVDPVQRRIRTTGEATHLSPISIDLLLQLAETPKVTVRRLELKTRAWRDSHVADGSLDRQIHDLRKHLKDIGSKIGIRSVYGQGYVLEINEL